MLWYLMSACADANSTLASSTAAIHCKVLASRCHNSAGFTVANTSSTWAIMLNNKASNAPMLAVNNTSINK